MLGRLREACQKHLAEKLSISTLNKAAISYILCYYNSVIKKPSVFVMAKIAKALGISLNKLIKVYGGKEKGV